MLLPGRCGTSGEMWYLQGDVVTPVPPGVPHVPEADEGPAGTAKHHGPLTQPLVASEKLSRVVPTLTRDHMFCPVLFLCKGVPGTADMELCPPALRSPGYPPNLLPSGTLRHGPLGALPPPFPAKRYP